MSNELAKPGQPFKIGVQKVGLAAKKAEAAKNNPERIEITTPPEEMPQRIGIEFDDSGSMYGQTIKDAHAGCEEFLRSCDPKTTAVAVYPMNEEDHKPVKLSVNLYMVATLIKGIGATGGTPLFATLMRMISSENLTRAIVFSDGSPNFDDQNREEDAIKMALEKKIPVDTVYIGHGDSPILKNLAEKTGGIYLHFDPTKSNFRTAFKYLSPGFRAMLADKSFVEKLQKGEV